MSLGLYTDIRAIALLGDSVSYDTLRLQCHTTTNMVSQLVSVSFFRRLSFFKINSSRFTVAIVVFVNSILSVCLFMCVPFYLSI